MQYTKIDDRYIVKLERGEDVVATLTQFAEQEQIGFATITALGAVDQISCGYYTLTDREYHFKSYEGMFEVLNATGNIAQKEGKPFVHLHAIFSDETNATFGGHVDQMRVGLVLEVVLTVSSGSVARSFDEGTGLFLMDMNG